MKKLAVSILVCCMCLCGFSYNIMAVDYDFENNEDMYYQMCSRSGLTSDERAVCKLFQDYLNQKAANIQKEIEAASKELAELKKDLNAVVKKINDFNTMIANIEAQQAALTLQIKDIEGNINILEIEIEARMNRIAEIDEQLRLRMYNMQAIFSMNKYIEYLMGATDFADLIRRTSALNQLVDYDTTQMQLLEDEKLQLEADVAEMEEQKASLQEQKALYETTKKTLKEAKAVQEMYKAEYLKKQAEIEAAKRSIESELDIIQDQIKDIAEKIDYIPPSAGWIYPVKENFYISAGAWYYPSSFGGGIHLGVDFAAGKTKHVVAPANGIVVYVYDKCTSGGLGNGCGIPWGGGNQVLLIVQVGSHTYGILNCHMSKGIDVKAGEIVKQGAILGNVGSTGNSSGAHLHQEIYDLGSMTIQQAVNKFKNSGDVTFGTGWNTLSTTCDNKGTPCRMNPQKIYNVKVGKSYN